MNHDHSFPCCKIFVRQCLAPWMLAQRKHIAGFISEVCKVDVMEGERAQGIEGICKRVIIKKTLEQGLLKEGSEFLRGWSIEMKQ